MTAFRLIGHEGSPYSRKMRAVLRYRHIPHRWEIRGGPEYRDPPQTARDMVPILVWPDGTAEIDSTPLIRRLESEYPSRSIIPTDPALAWLNDLIEDFADEWLTKMMFHYRWRRQADIDWSQSQLIAATNPSLPNAQMQQLGDLFGQRQIGRLWVVGSTDATAGVIEAGYERLLATLEEGLSRQMFLFGERPAAADFALAGQLAQLCLWDPTPVALARAKAPRLVAWVQRMEDLSGWPDDVDWVSREACAEHLAPLLGEIARGYGPAMQANAAARQQGEDSWSTTIDGQAWEQKTVAYQAKCIGALRQSYADLSAADQAWLGQLLSAQGGTDWLED